MRTGFLAAALAVGGSLAVLASPATAQAAANVVSHVASVSDLAAVCDPSWSGVPRLEAIAYCQGYLTAAVQYHALTRPGRGRGARPLFCVPAQGPTIAQSGLAFAAWARANPRHAREPALDGLLRWAQATHPCRAPAARPPAGSR